MNIDSIQNGIVLDHITPGRSMEIYKYLHLDALTCSVAIIKNVKSTLNDRKDIIKIDEVIDLDMDVLGYIDPGITVNIIKDAEIVEKFRPALPKRLVNVLHCKNPRCITRVEAEIDQIFDLSDRETRTYRCAYCETAAKPAGKL